VGQFEKIVWHRHSCRCFFLRGACEGAVRASPDSGVKRCATDERPVFDRAPLIGLPAEVFRFEKSRKAALHFAAQALQVWTSASGADSSLRFGMTLSRIGNQLDVPTSLRLYFVQARPRAASAGVTRKGLHLKSSHCNDRLLAQRPLLFFLPSSLEGCSVSGTLRPLQFPG
jgi:hypothetical protein